MYRRKPISQIKSVRDGIKSKTSSKEVELFKEKALTTWVKNKEY